MGRRTSGFRRLYTAAIAGAAFWLLSGCSVGGALSSGNPSEKEYGRPETLVIVTSERLRYEELYSEQIWNAAVDNRGTTFDTVLTSQIHDFLRELKAMSRMAEEENIRLSSREGELVKEAARKYYETLGGTDASKLGIDERALEAFYEDYWTAQKLVDSLTSDTNLEVSDSEAKVISVLQIELSDRDLAEAVLAEVTAEGADFQTIAKETSEDPEISVKLLRGTRGTDFEEAAFALAEGEISGVLSDNGRYYIVRCVDDYDETATAERKKQMIREKKNAAFYEKFEDWRDALTLAGDDAVWKDLTVSGSLKVSADFFGIFDEVCLEE